MSYTHKRVISSRPLLKALIVQQKFLLGEIHSAEEQSGEEHHEDTSDYWMEEKGPFLDRQEMKL